MTSTLADTMDSASFGVSRQRGRLAPFASASGCLCFLCRSLLGGRGITPDPSLRLGYPRLAVSLGFSFTSPRFEDRVFIESWSRIIGVVAYKSEHETRTVGPLPNDGVLEQ